MCSRIDRMRIIDSARTSEKENLEAKISGNFIRNSTRSKKHIYDSIIRTYVIDCVCVYYIWSSQKQTNLYGKTDKRVTVALYRERNISNGEWKQYFLDAINVLHCMKFTLTPHKNCCTWNYRKITTTSLVSLAH